MADGVPSDALCLGCGYRLHGLPEHVCPECARPFDPADRRTFTTSRHRRTRRRIIAASAIVVLLIGFAPHGIRSGSVQFSYPDANRVVTVRRWELVAPGWLPFRYPAFHWTSRDDSTAVSPIKPPVPVKGAFQVRFSASGLSGTFGGGSVGTETNAPLINGLACTPENAAAVLAELMAPDCTGVSVGNPGLRSLLGVPSIETVPTTEVNQTGEADGE